MDKIKKKQKNREGLLQEAVLEAKQLAETIAKEGKRLYDDQEINGEDLHKILLAIANLFKYLNKKYGKDERLEEEVRSMTKSLYDPVVEERALIQGEEIGKNRKAFEVAKEMIEGGEPIEKIIKYSKLTQVDIEKLKAEMLKH